MLSSKYSEQKLIPGILKYSSESYFLKVSGVFHTSIYKLELRKIRGMVLKLKLKFLMAECYLIKNFLPLAENSQHLMDLRNLENLTQD